MCAIHISEQNWQRLWRHWFPFRNPRIQVNFCLSHKSIWYVWLKSSCRNSNETTVSRVTCCQIYLLTEINLLSSLLAMVLITDFPCKEGNKSVKTACMALCSSTFYYRHLLFDHSCNWSICFYFIVQQTKCFPSTQSCPCLPPSGSFTTVCGYRIHRTFHAV